MIAVDPMLLIQNGCCKYIIENLALLLLLKETSPAVLSSSSMWLHSIKKDRETHGEFVFIFVGMCYHIYLNILSYLLDCCHIYRNVINLSYLLEYVIIFIYC